MKAHDKAWVVTVLMGLGHLRAAYPLRDLTHEGVIIYGSRRTTPRPEYGIWRRLRRLYYASSKAGAIPVIGKTLLAAAAGRPAHPPVLPEDRPVQAEPGREIPQADDPEAGALPEPPGQAGRGARIRPSTRSTRRRSRWTCSSGRIPTGSRDQYLLICDADFNRVWVPEDPETSRIRYLAPCTQVRRRLLAYGVPDDAILMTGFPLPKENIGSEAGLEILKADLFERLLRLDPAGKFFSYHERSVLGWLGRDAVPAAREAHFTVMFAIGGAGAQAEMVKKILASLADRIRAGEVRLIALVRHPEKGLRARPGVHQRDGPARRARPGPRDRSTTRISTPTWTGSTTGFAGPTFSGRSRASWPSTAGWACPS